MRFRQRDHPRQAIGKKIVVRGNDFAILAVRGNGAEGPVVVLDDGNQHVIMNNVDTRVFGGVFLRNFPSFIFTAIIDDGVFPVGIGLRHHAFNTFSEIGLAVINRGKYANQRLVLNIHVSQVLQPLPTTFQTMANYDLDRKLKWLTTAISD
jgi:hypothetical protein